MKLLTISSIVLIIGSLVLIASNLDLLKTEKEGEIVLMKIEKLPASCLGTKVSHFVTLSYKGSEFEKKIGGTFCDDHHVGELIKMRYLEGSETALFPDESAISNLISYALLGIVGIIILVKQILKK